MPEAVPQGVQRLVAELGVETLDRIWIFPPLISGRKESGLLAVSRYAEGEDADRRILVTLPYSAERTGKGLTLESSVEEQGEAPMDRFPRVMEGVVRRTEQDLGEPREVEIQGDAVLLEAFLEEYDTGLLDPELPPLAEPMEESPEAAGDEATAEVEPALDADEPDPEATDAGGTDLLDWYAPEPTP